MERNIAAYKAWAPFDSPWGQWAKPILFVGERQTPLQGNETIEMDIPQDLSNMYDSQTAIIVDLPGKQGVLKGLGLAEDGYRPVPLYNGVPAEKVGSLKPIVETQGMIDGLLAGALYLDGLTIPANAPPAFLLDYDRAKASAESDDLYDNRWSVDLADVPQASVLLAQGINRVVVWTRGELNEDLGPILAMYQAGGIALFLYRGGEFFEYGGEEAANHRPVRFRRRFFHRFFRRPLAQRGRISCSYVAGGTGGYGSRSGYFGSGSYNPGSGATTGQGSKGYKGYGGYSGYGGTGKGGYSGRGFSGSRGSFGGGYGG